MNVQIYTKTSCIFCQRAKAWMAENGIPYDEIDVSASADFTKMKEDIPGAVTVPQIIIDGNVIGGYDTLMAYEGPILKKLRVAYPA